MQRRWNGSWWWVVALAGLVGLVGCGQRQAVAPAETGRAPEDVPNDTGGYAGKLAKPPETVETLPPEKVEELIQEGRSSDSHDPVKEPDVEEDHQHDAKPAEAGEKPAAAEASKATPDHSKDRFWDSIKNPVVAIQTNKGTFYLELWPDVAPKHVENFLKLVKSKFYDGIYAHRVIPGFVMQAGDPMTKQYGPNFPEAGQGGPGWTVKAEFSDKPHVRGTLAMARAADPDSAGSQFYICYKRLPDLDGKYTVFGQVLGDGMTVVDEMVKGDQILFAWVVHE